MSAETPPSPAQEARTLALARISLREHSARELERHLCKKGVEAELAARIIAELVEDRLIDDRRYARAVARSQAVRDKGPMYILQKLRQKGVRIELAEVSALFEETSDRDQAEAIRHVIERRYPRASEDEKQWRRALGGLQRRGFSSDLIFKALGRPPRGFTD